MAEIVVADGGYDGARVTELPDLIDEDRRRAARKWSDQRLRRPKPLAALSGHDLHQNFADGGDERHRRPLPSGREEAHGLRVRVDHAFIDGVHFLVEQRCATECGPFRPER